MIDLDYIYALEYFGNTGKDYLIAAGIFFAAIIVLWIFKVYIVHILKKLSRKTKTEIDDIAIDFIDNIHWQFYVYLSLFIGSRYLSIPATVDKVLTVVLLILVAYYGIKAVSETIDFMTKRAIQKRKKEDEDDDFSLVKVLARMAKTVVWILAFLAILSNLGIDITSAIAGLGIAGIAIAFALQNVLEDLFSSFSIYFDKPFKVGHFIIIGGDMGVVKYIGLKTTRLQTLQGQELVISNRELTSTRINNYKHMEKRRIVFAFGVEYSTSMKKMKMINKIVEEAVNQQKLVKLDRVHFKDFGDFSLNYEVVYYLDSSDYNVYMDTQQAINLAIKDMFEKNKISMAFPTQTVFVEK